MWANYWLIIYSTFLLAIEICETGAGSSVKAGGLFSNMAKLPEYSLVAAIFKGQLEAQD